MTYTNVPTRPQVEPVTYYTRLQVPEWENANTWCGTCRIHRATVNQPQCPVCLDEIRRKRQS